jgi:hypothetical protein
MSDAIAFAERLLALTDLCLGQGRPSERLFLGRLDLAII